MRNVVLDNVFYKQRCEIDTYNRINQIEPVDVVSNKARRQEELYLTYYPVEHEGSNGGEETHKDS